MCCVKWRLEWMQDHSWIEWFCWFSGGCPGGSGWSSPAGGRYSSDKNSPAHTLLYRAGLLDLPLKSASHGLYVQSIFILLLFLNIFPTNHTIHTFLNQIATIYYIHLLILIQSVLLLFINLLLYLSFLSNTY